MVCKLFLGLSLALGVATGLGAETKPSPVVIRHAAALETLDIAPVWAGHPVRFALLTRPPLQFVAFYDDQRQLTLAQRRLDQSQWTFSKLPDRTGWDSHNYLALAADDEGYLHLSGDMHAIPLKYFRTTKPLDASTFASALPMVGPNEQRATYPHFFRGATNELVFTYRDGSSGNGNQIFDAYNAATKTWRRLFDGPLTDGEGRRNAYFDGPVKGPDGWFHLAWVWRESPDAASNHHLCYARSRDLVHWEGGSGRPLPRPITLATSDVVDPVPEKGGIINGNTRIGFDQQDRVTISYHKHDPAGNTQPWTARLEAGKWQRYQVTDWPYHWDFGGGGSLVFSITLGPVHREDDGRLTQTYGHVKFGGGTWLLDPQTLRATGQVQSQETPPALGKVEGAFPGLHVRWANDLGASGVPGVSYKLRWETLEANRDRPRTGDLPPPSPLRLITVKTTKG